MHETDYNASYKFKLKRKDAGNLHNITNKLKLKLKDVGLYKANAVVQCHWFNRNNSTEQLTIYGR